MNTTVSANSSKDDRIMQHAVFVYGTLKKGQPNYFHFSETDHGTVKYCGKSVLKGTVCKRNVYK